MIIWSSSEVALHFLGLFCICCVIICPFYSDPRSFCGHLKALMSFFSLSFIIILYLCSCVLSLYVHFKSIWCIFFLYICLCGYFESFYDVFESVIF